MSPRNGAKSKLRNKGKLDADKVSKGKLVDLVDGLKVAEQKYHQMVVVRH